MTASSTLTVAQAEARVLAAAREWAAAAIAFDIAREAGLPMTARVALAGASGAAERATREAAFALAQADAREAATAAGMERAAREGGAS